MKNIAFDNSTPPQLWEWEGDVDDPVPEPIKRVTIDDVIFMFNEQAAEIERLKERHAVMRESLQFWNRPVIDGIKVAEVIDHIKYILKDDTSERLQAELNELRRRV